MKINVLTEPQNPFGRTILYAPELELPEAVSVAEKCYPAVNYNDNFGSEFFFILISEIGEYEESPRIVGKGIMYDYFGGKEGLEKEFKKMYDDQYKCLTK